MLKKIITIIGIAIFGISANCDFPTNINDTPSVISTDCASAQKHLEAMCAANPIGNEYCCQVVKPTKKGKSFEQFCNETQDAGIDLNTKCLSAITSCNQIDICIGVKK